MHANITTAHDCRLSAEGLFTTWLRRLLYSPPAVLFLNGFYAYLIWENAFMKYVNESYNISLLTWKDKIFSSRNLSVTRCTLNCWINLRRSGIWYERHYPALSQSSGSVKSTTILVGLGNAFYRWCEMLILIVNILLEYFCDIIYRYLIVLVFGPPYNASQLCMWNLFRERGIIWCRQRRKQTGF